MAKKRSGPTKRTRPPKAITPSPIPLVLLRLFQRQVADQCEFALRAAADLMAYHDPWYAAQSLLGAVGNISKALWGQTPVQEKARQPLRDSLGISEQSPLKLRDLRNHWEHFDERLDEWWRDSPRHNYIDRNYTIGGGTIVAGSGLDLIDVFRNYENGELIFWGDVFNVPLIVAECQRLHQVAKAESDKPHWEPPSNISGIGQ